MSVSNPTPPPVEKQYDPPQFLVPANPLAPIPLACCPRAQTLHALCPDLGCQVVIPLPCLTWSCPHCSRRKIARLAGRVRDAAPNRFLTLTVDPSLWASPEEAFLETRRRISPLASFLRKKFGPLEYLRVLEVTKKGWPHYHLLVRSGFLPHEVVKAAWQRLTGAAIVDLRQIKATRDVYAYVVKYIAKAHALPWTKRHLSSMKDFFRPDPPRTGPRYTLLEMKRIPDHPFVVLFSDFPASRVTAITPNLWALDYQPPERGE